MGFDCQDEVSAYLIPARGLKQFFVCSIYELQKCFRISNPRKGTETFYYSWMRSPFLSFRISNPRKGTETRKFFHPHPDPSKFPHI